MLFIIHWFVLRILRAPYKNDPVKWTSSPPPKPMEDPKNLGRKNSKTCISPIYVPKYGVLRPSFDPSLCPRSREVRTSTG